LVIQKYQKTGENLKTFFDSLLGRKKYVYKNDSFVIQIKATYNVQE
jgi:hypothetical protein